MDAHEKERLAHTIAPLASRTRKPTNVSGAVPMVDEQPLKRARTQLHRLGPPPLTEKPLPASDSAASSSTPTYTATQDVAVKRPPPYVTNRDDTARTETRVPSESLPPFPYNPFVGLGQDEELADIADWSDIDDLIDEKGTGF